MAEKADIKGKNNSTIWNWTVGIFYSLLTTN